MIQEVVAFLHILRGINGFETIRSYCFHMGNKSRTAVLVSPARKNGFTLVELSIVLVVIGLLIGGILAAKSMIKTAQLNSQVVQVQQWETAISNFQNKYNGLPGDAVSFGGNGDGRVQCPAFNCTTLSDIAWNGEIMNFWKNLSEMENFPRTYSTTLTGNMIRVNANIPKLKIGDEISSATFGVSNTSRPSPFWPENYYFLGKILLWDQYFRSSTALSAVEAASLDKKIDDGVANSGNVLAVSGGAAGAGLGFPANSTVNSGCVMNGNLSLYNIASTSTFPCALAVRFGSLSGRTE